MSPAPNRHRAPYWTLGVLAGLLMLPFGWAVGVVVGVGLARIAWAVVAARRGRRDRAHGRSSEVRLGVDPRGRPVSLGADELGAHALIVGASGAGKSTTLLRILDEQITAGRPVVALDLKGSPAFAAGLEQAAQRAGRPFRIWTLDGPARWNPLAHGNPTELKDRLISSERFSEPHYRRAAERYVQSALQVLRASGRPADLAAVVALMDPRRLSALVRGLDSPLGERVRDYLDSLTPDQLSAIHGLGTRLAVLSESSAGPYLQGSSSGPPATDAHIDLRAGLAGGEVILFSLNSSRYGSLAAQIGTLAIQDLISASGERLAAGGAPIAATVAIDEFSALGSDHVLALLARGRESGFGVLLATQELSDLERAGRGFRDQVLGLTTVKIAHRQDVPGSAQTIAEMAGTRLVWEETRNLNGPWPSSGSRGTRRQARRFRVEPDVVKTLRPGEALLLVKSPGTRITLVRVRRAETAPVAGVVPRPATPPRSRPGPTRSQPAPTRSQPERTRSRPALPRPAGRSSAGSAPRGGTGAGRDDQPEPGVTR
ncbi:MAG TPA: TraM recognition domain-containing protein [Solirubrobacteraceae bacterium]